MQRAYSLLTIKALDDDARVIEGMASTPTTDRMGDIVEPLGAEFTLPLPLLWQHNSREPIGHVTKAKVTKDGIEIRAELVKWDEPGDLKNLLDKAWAMLKTGLVRGLSIGFSALEEAAIKGTFGIHFLRWEWLELSAVTIPANIDASIATIKSYDTDPSAAPGTAARGLKTPGASGSVKLLSPLPGARTVDIRTQITSLEATRQAKAARQNEIQEKVSKEGRTKDTAEREEFDALTGDLAGIDAEMKDLRDLEARNAAAAKPVGSPETIDDASKTRGGIAIVKTPEKLDPGIEFARFAMCLAAAKGNVPQALALAETHYPQQVRGIAVLKSAARYGMSMRRYADELVQTKTAIPAGTTTDSTWASPLVQYNQFAGDFVEFLRPQTILGRFGQGGIPDLRRIPFNVHIRGQTTGGTSYWVGQGKAKPVTKFGFNDTYHGWAKVASIAVLTEDLIRFSNPSAERLVRDSLAASAIERLDTDFVDPALAISAGVSPASVTNGVVAITSSGDTADDVRTDIAALWAAAMAANLPLTSAVYITTPAIALSLSLMMNPLGQAEFPGITMNGGTLLGVPVITSNYVPIATFILAFASEIYLSDDGAVTIDASTEASIEMADNPTNASATPTATSLVSMYQTDSIALRLHRFINWSKRRSTAVALLDGVGWGGVATS